jgi:3-dehydroquinate dehydratase
MRKISSQCNTEAENEVDTQLLQKQYEKEIMRRMQGLNEGVRVYVESARNSDTPSTAVVDNLALLKDKLQEVHSLIQTLFQKECAENFATQSFF